MNVRGDITAEWADGTYAFRLTFAGAIELEQKCDAAISIIAHRLNAGIYTATDVRETIRLGLIGGGMEPVPALKLVRQYVEERPLAESHPMARLIMGGLMFGFVDQPVGKEPAAPTATEASPPELTPQPDTKPWPCSDLEALLEPYPSGNFTP